MAASKLERRANHVSRSCRPSIITLPAPVLTTLRPATVRAPATRRPPWEALSLGCGRRPSTPCHAIACLSQSNGMDVIARNALVASTSCWACFDRARCDACLLCPAGKQRGVSGGVALVDKCLLTRLHFLFLFIVPSVFLFPSSSQYIFRAYLLALSLCCYFLLRSTCTLH